MPRVLLLDIETSPIISYTWGLFEQNVGLEQIKEDWYVLSWAAKWQGESKVMYKDISLFSPLSRDKYILKGIWELLNEADIIVTQNGKRFDVKKLNARFLLAGMKPPSPYRHIDTLQLAKKNFAMTSNKLAYMSDRLCPKKAKSEHKEFPGFTLWKECLAGNKRAWAEMKKYNIQDVIALEAVYEALAPWGTGIKLDTYNDGPKQTCSCGGTKFQRRGFDFTQLGKFQRLQCQGCGAWSRDSENLLSAEKRKSIRR